MASNKKIAQPTIPADIHIERVKVLIGGRTDRLMWQLKFSGLAVAGTQPKIGIDQRTGRKLYEQVSDTEMNVDLWIKKINTDLTNAYRRAKWIINGVPMIDETTKDRISEAKNCLDSAITKAQRELDVMWQFGWMDFVVNNPKYNS